MPRVDLDVVRSAAQPHWKSIHTQLGGIDPEFLDGRHHECPRCGGTDRFRFFDDGTGGAICNQCKSQGGGDGFAILCWYTGKDLNTVAREVAEYCHLREEDYLLKNGRGRKKKKADPEEHLRFQEWNDTLAAMWCQARPPITPEVLLEFGAKQAMYRDTFSVMAIPIWGKDLDKAVGWVIFDIGGGTLPKYGKKGTKPEDVKMKMTYGSEAGLIAPVERIKAGDYKAVWKAEGVTDVLSLATILPNDHLPVTNSSGAKEDPKKKRWMLNLFTGKPAYIIHDCDRPGQDGATYVGEEDRKRPGWCPMLLDAGAGPVYNIVLPYPVLPERGKDFRHWANEEPRTFESLEDLVSNTEEFVPDDQVETIRVEEAIDDPFRLARDNLRKYAKRNRGAQLRFWRDQWYTWKGACYRTIGKPELRAKVTLSVKEEFDNHNISEQQSGSEEISYAKKISRTLINDVIAATESMCVIPEHVEQGTWIDGQIREQRNYISFMNGIVDMDAALADKEIDEVLIAHSPSWFSEVSLPYDFDPDADCPQWLKFLDHNLEGDQERIRVLQEWAGYCLLPDTGYQKFVLLEGDGSNGKSVYMSGLEAMLGKKNCSHVSLEVFGDRFTRTNTIGKLLNIAADVHDIDKIAEGFLKAFVSGDTMYFDRKGIDGISASPTARMLMSCNTRPRFADKSNGIWRRIIPVPWHVQIADEDKIKDMDQASWWIQSGELPGIFLWALVGLARLREQGGFTDSAIVQATLKDYREEMNPTAAFLREHMESSDGGFIRTEFAYELYQEWCKKNGNKPLSSRQFGKELSRMFKKSSKQRREIITDTSASRERKYVYAKVVWKTSAVAGKSTLDPITFASNF